MRWLIRAIVPLIAACATPVLAEDYRAGADAFFDRVKEGGQVAEAFGLRGTYYFGDVDTSDVPLSEAAFLGRESRMSLSARRSNTDDHYDSQQFDTEIYVSTGVPVYLSASLYRFEIQEFDVGTGEYQAGHDTAWQAAVGLVPIDGLRVSTSFYQDGGYDPNLLVKYVGKLPNTHWFGLLLAAVEADDGNVYWDAGAQYYFDETFKVDAMWSDGLEQWVVGVEKFFTGRASAGFAYFENPYWSGFEIRGGWRF
jgi:hypothetical protein